MFFRLLIFMLTLGIVTQIDIGSGFSVKEKEYAVVTRLGKPVRGYSAPGKYYKIPLVEQGEIQQKIGSRGDIQREASTLDGIPVHLFGVAYWEVSEPLLFRKKADNKDPRKCKAVNAILNDLEKEIIKLSNLAELTDDPYLSFRSALKPVTPQIKKKFMDRANKRLKDWGIKIKKVQMDVHPIE